MGSYEVSESAHHTYGLHLFIWATPALSLLVKLIAFVRKKMFIIRAPWTSRKPQTEPQDSKSKCGAGYILFKTHISYYSVFTSLSAVPLGISECPRAECNL